MLDPTTPPAPTGSAPTAHAVPTPPAVNPLVEPHTYADLSETEAAMMAGWVKEDLAKGKMTQAQADRVFGKLKTPMDQRAPDSRSDEVKALDTAFPQAKESDYNIPYFLPGQAPPVMPKALVEFDQSARSWLAAAQFDRTLSNSLVNAIAKTVQTTKGMDANQLEQYGFDEFAKLEQCYGRELETKLHQAAVMIHELDQKTHGLKNLLKSKGIGDNAWR